VRISWLGCLILLVCACGALSAAQVTVPPSNDNTLYESATGSLSDGAGQYFFSGRTSQATGSLRRSLMRFDIAAAVPAGATISSVTLTLHCSSAAGDVEVHSLHRLLTDWGEGTSDAAGAEGQGITATTGDATWLNTFYPSSFWATAGGDFAAASSSDANVDLADAFYSWSSAQMAADVQAWLNQPATNFGWLLQGNESLSGTAKRFDSRESPTVSFRPALTITYVLTTGDMNCDGQVDLADVAPFVSAVLDPAGFSGCDATRADCNFDGFIDGRDVMAFVHFALGL